MNRISIKIAVLTFLLIIASGCKRDQRMPYLGLVEDAEIELQTEKFILIVPQNGCSTCVKKSYDFILKNYANPNIKYVFTHYASKKRVKVRFIVQGQKDVSRIGFVDLPIVQKYDVSTFYPTLLELNANGEAKVVLMNADDMSDWDELRKNI